MVAHRPRTWLMAVAASWLVAATAAEEAAFRLDGAPMQGALVRGTVPDGTAALTLDSEAVPLTSDGRFLIGFDRDAQPGARLVARLGDGREIVRALSVAPRAWPI